jgi:hypothetical protein
MLAVEGTPATHRGVTFDAVLSRDGRFVLASAERTLRWCAMAGNKEPRVFPVGEIARRVALSPDGKLVLVSVKPGPCGEPSLRLWDLVEGKGGC